MTDLYADWIDFLRSNDGFRYVRFLEAGGIRETEPEVYQVPKRFRLFTVQPPIGVASNETQKQPS